ncbi:uncharacterized protein A4U43_C08F13240 [Asparagus officinalis]|uniref:BTB/POZ domain-containing protein NPY2-like n=1 Tax=Asparagus officinalis TaxID=4686 RepID=UPI00098E5D21|nr:BTB/POZ domain-containing protein NPY2-like [Asparagus officinalis]ONK60008.1 uncharacterized protein A4U43_C08F13240 [Asparagus officinalis]
MKFMKLGSKPDSFQDDGNGIRFVTTELATDVIVNVGDVKFYLHKFPLLSKSARLQQLATSNSSENDEIQIDDIPGGAAAFEICAKFCYGMTVTLNAYNVIAARCAAEYLEMHETVEKGNLIYKVEIFLSTSIFRSWKDSIIVLQTTKFLLPWSEDLKLASHCIESIACRASIDASKVDWSYTYNRKKLPSENGLDASWNGVRKQQSVPKDWWVEDLCELELDLYKRVIVAIRAKGRVTNKVMGEALKAYTYRKLPGFSKGSAIERGDNAKSQSLLETVIRLLPEGKGSVSCSFLLRLLKAASFFNCSEFCKRELIKRIGLQLEEASVSDLLLPAAPGEITVYDIDTILSILEEFVMQEKYLAEKSSKVAEVEEVINPVLVSNCSKVNVAKLVDGYLTEISKDQNLPLSKFLDLTEMVPGDLRPVHDGLYRAIDMYLKEHPSLSKSEKKKICSLMDCRKLSADACAHVVQNERLPLRMVVQVLFYEQARASLNVHETGSGGSYGSSR